MYNTSKSDSGELVGSLLGGTNLNCVGHRECVRRASAETIKKREYLDMTDLDRWKELSGGQERNCLHRETSNGAWISAIPHRLNSTYLSREEFQDILYLRYRLIPQEIPAPCDGCSKKFSIKHDLS